jgi:hypothetical protein
LLELTTCRWLACVWSLCFCWNLHGFIGTLCSSASSRPAFLSCTDPLEVLIYAACSHWRIPTTYIEKVLYAWADATVLHRAQSISTLGHPRPALSRPRILSNSGEKFSLLYCLRWLKFYKNLKLLSLFESFNWKLF